LGAVPSHGTAAELAVIEDHERIIAPKAPGGAGFGTENVMGLRRFFWTHTHAAINQCGS